jgi:hypothetical protein
VERVDCKKKLLYVPNKINEAAQTIGQCVYETLLSNELVSKGTTFSGDICNTVFGGVARATTNNVLVKLKDSVKDKLIGQCCPAYILNNCM